MWLDPRIVICIPVWETAESEESGWQRNAEKSVEEHMNKLLTNFVIKT